MEEMHLFVRDHTPDHEMHSFTKNKNDWYDFIFGAGFLQAISVDIILFSRNVIIWDSIGVEMT